MTKLVFSLITVLLSVLTITCRNSKPARGTDGSSFSGHEWKLTELNGRPVPPASKASMAFATGEENRVSGNTGCNRFSGRYDLETNGGIRFSPMAVTKMACMDEGAGQREQEFLQVLEAATSWTMEGELLRFHGANTVLAVFRKLRQPTKEEAKLNGTWELYDISGPRIAFEGLFPTKKPTLVLNLPEPEATGNGGCNGYGCLVKTEGKNKISFGDPLSTMMACEGNGEPLYFKALKRVTSYEFEADTVLVLAATEGPVLRFRKK